MANFYPILLVPYFLSGVQAKALEIKLQLFYKYASEIEQIVTALI